MGYTAYIRKLIVSALLLLGGSVFSQTVIDTVSQASINTTLTSKGIEFSAQLPPLVGIPGGRAPYYTYFWDFGDGHFSRQRQPIHAYAKAGNYQVKLYATNNYDKGKKPPRPVKNVNVQYAMAQPTIGIDERAFLKGKQIFKLGKNTNALPGTDIVLIAGVKPVSGSGKIYILSNEKIFGPPGFAYNDQTHYFDEKTVQSLQKTKPFYASTNQIASATITRSGSPNYGKAQHKTFTQDEAVSFFRKLYNSYQTVTHYKITKSSANEQFSYIHINVLPEMIQDTNAIVTLTAIYLPDSTDKAYIHRLDIPVVTSHDPNRMSVKQTRLNYRTTARGKRLTYKVKFQNNGKGDAKNIRLEMVLPQAMDSASFKLLNLYPRIPQCTDSTPSSCWRKEWVSSDSLIFYFNGISLPGSQAEREVPHDSTEGFVRFSIKAEKRLPNKPFKAKTAIYFDKNEPVITNWATGRFRKSLSPILFLGYNFITAGKESLHLNTAAGMPIDIPYKYKNNFTIGIGLAPLAPYKKLFWQAELRVGYFEQTASISGDRAQGSIMIDNKQYFYHLFSSDYQKKNVRLQLDLLPLKYNLNSWFSVGVGIEGNINFVVDNQEKMTVHTLSNGIKSAKKELDKAKNTVHWRPFADFNFGRVYLGPSLGIRYYFGLNDISSLATYVSWRF